MSDSCHDFRDLIVADTLHELENLETRKQRLPGFSVLINTRLGMMQQFGNVLVLVKYDRWRVVPETAAASTMRPGAGNRSLSMGAGVLFLLIPAAAAILLLCRWTL